MLAAIAIIILSINSIILFFYAISLHNKIDDMRATNNNSIKIAKISVATLMNFHNEIVSKYGIDKIARVEDFSTNMIKILNIQPDDLDGGIIITDDDLI